MDWVIIVRGVHYKSQFGSLLFSPVSWSSAFAVERCSRTALTRWRGVAWTSQPLELKEVNFCSLQITQPQALCYCSTRQTKTWRHSDSLVLVLNQGHFDMEPLSSQSFFLPSNNETLPRPRPDSVSCHANPSLHGNQVLEAQRGRLCQHLSNKNLALYSIKSLFTQNSYQK
jgi:hypothetical protein